MKKLFIIAGLLLFFSSCGSKTSNYYFKAAQIKDHPNPDKVKKIMNAEPDSSFTRWFLGKEWFVQLYYNKDSLEFRFNKNGKLLEVIINKPSFEYTPKSITRFGLPFREPNKKDTSAFFSWKNMYEGFDAISSYLVGRRPSEGKTYFRMYFNLKD